MTDQAEGFAQKPLAKTDREIKLETLLTKALDVIDHYDKICLMAPNLIPKGYETSRTLELIQVAEETSKSTHDFINLSKAVLDGR